MAGPSLANLVETLSRQGLLEPEQRAALESLAGQGTDAKAFLKDLLKRNWLTRFQAQMLWKGQGNDLALGSYILLDALGEGGMGHVYKARHRHLHRTVAIKRMRAEFLSNERAVKRFQREVRAVAQLAHPNIVLAYDADQVGDSHFLVMEYVEGSDLAQWVKEHGPLRIDAAVSVVRQTAAGLQHAFERGLVHRDIKPSNLLWTPQGQVKILDLGLARFEGVADSINPALTRQGTVLGSVDFIAPEQATDAASADIRADLYSLGCTFYYLLTGQVPYPGGELLEKVLKHRLENPIPVELIRPEVPEWIIGVVRTLMMKRPEDRYATPEALSAALNEPNPTEPGTSLAKGPPGESADRPRASAAPAGAAFAHLHSESPDVMPQRRRRLTLRWVGGVLALSLGVGIMLYWLGQIIK